MDAGNTRRRFVTARGVEDAREAGVIGLGPRDVITDEAAQRARDLGIEVRREVRPGASAPETTREPKPAPQTEPTPEPTTHSTPEPLPEPTPELEPVPAASLRDVVLAALHEELGARAIGIEQVLDAVLAREASEEEGTRGLGVRNGRELSPDAPHSFTEVKNVFISNE
jgi:hypothetical protein